jgi:hypothetical protein
MGRTAPEHGSYAEHAVLLAEATIPATEHRGRPGVRMAGGSAGQTPEGVSRVFFRIGGR